MFRIKIINICDFLVHVMQNVIICYYFLSESDKICFFFLSDGFLLLLLCSYGHLYLFSSSRKVHLIQENTVKSLILQDAKPYIISYTLHPLEHEINVFGDP